LEETQVTWLSTPALTALCGFGGGIVLGFAARQGRFCSLGAIEDFLLLSDARRLRSWAVAIAVAILGTQILQALGWIDLTQSLYLARQINLPAAIIGGLMFGAGMALAGTCGFGALSRIGGGDLRALVIVLVMSISAYAMMNGVTAFVRVGLFDLFAVTTEHPPDLGAWIAGLVPGLSPLIVAVLVSAGLLWIALRDRRFRSERRLILAGVGVGLAVCWGWLATSIVGGDPFEPQRLESYTFVRPLGDTLVFLIAYTGTQIKFGIGAVFGVVAGSLLGALSQGRLRWEACDDPRELRRQIFGAFLMGSGGVLALGCTIGQGVAAASALAVSAPIVIVSIFTGAFIGLSWLIEGRPFAALGGIFARTHGGQTAKPSK